jgi:TatD DNase family protein
MQSGVNGFLHCACDIERILDISTVLDELADIENAHSYGAVALHPNEAAMHYFASENIFEIAPDGLEPKFEEHHQKYNIEQIIEIIAELFEKDQRIKVIGETGLDYFRTGEKGIEAQKKSFREHINLAKEFEKPLQIHDREAHRDVLEVLKKDGRPQTVLLHSFSGDKEFAQKCIEQGYFASFSGPITFKNANNLREAFLEYWQKAPELVLIETDCPFLTPEPNRGSPNAPGFLVDTLRFLSELIGISEVDLANQFIKNETSIFQ